MNIELQSEFPVTEEACREMTGKSITEWIDELQSDANLATKRREAINYLYPAMNKNLFWPTTVWVEMERRLGRNAKDGKPEGYNICVTKSIKAPMDQVFNAFSGPQAARWAELESDADGNLKDANGNSAQLIRSRPNKDLRYGFQTSGVDTPTEVEVMFAEKDGKVGITLNHNRIQSRAEADGLRKAWGVALTNLKSQLEGA